MFLEIPVQLCTMRTVGTLELWLLATLQFHMIIKGLLPTIAFPTSCTYKSLTWKLMLSNIMSSIRCGLQQTKYLSEIWWLLKLSMLIQPSAILCMLIQPCALQCFFQWFKNINFPNIYFSWILMITPQSQPWKKINNILNSETSTQFILSNTLMDSDSDCNNYFSNIVYFWFKRVTMQVSYFNYKW